MALLILLASLLHAGPLVTRLDDVIADSEAIAVVEVLDDVSYGSMPRLRVIRAVRGDLSGAIAPARGVGTPTVSRGDRVVAFLGPGLTWSVMAAPAPGHSFDGLLHVDGFHDYNAHLVDPPLLSLSQLEAWLDGQPPAWRFVGPVVAPGPDGRRLVPTGRHLDVTVATSGSPAEVQGEPPAGMTRAVATLVPWHEPDVALVWHAGWPRPLTLHGRVTAWRADRAEVEWQVAEPDLLSVDEVEAWWTDPDAGVWLHDVALDLGGASWRATLGRPGRAVVFTDGAGDTHAVRGLAMAPTRALTFDDRVVVLTDPARPLPPGVRGAEAQLLHELVQGPIAVRVADGVGAGATGALSLVGPGYAPR